MLLLALGISFGCAGSGDPASEPAPKTAEELFGEANETLNGFSVLYLLESVDYPRAIAQFQEIIDNYPFSEFATLSELKIADAYFDQRDYVQAASFYQEFVELHPTHPKVAYALLRNGECAFQQMLAPDQDQGKTREAIQLFDALTDRFPRTEEAARAVELRVQAREQLAIHEVVIGDFYFETEKYHAAVPRYVDALEFSPQHEGFRRTRARLGMSLRRVGQTEKGDALLQDALSDPELDGDTRERGEVELGFAVAVRDPAAEESGSSDSGGGWWFWPFGGGGDDTVESAATEDSEEVPSQAVAASQLGVAAEAREASNASASSPTGSEEDSAASEAVSDAPESESEAEESSRRWYWPF